MKALFGQKLGMTRVFTEQGEQVPVTVLELGPNTVYQVKTDDTDGYSAIQIGFGQRKAQRVNKALTGHFSKAKKGFPEFSAEIRFDRGQKVAKEEKAYSVGDVLTVEGMFNVGDRVDVVGTSIGKGFAGVVKRHGMKGAQTWSHGSHEYFRHGGSIGCRKFPGRVFKNKRMGGHMGVDQTIQEGLEVIAIRPQENLLLVRGSVPGSKFGKVLVRSSVRCA